ncbi:hypothetical protein K488DRAFT_82809 [Vararia minispora EC-137]|uniref:Uncharacterized protein n=1 Tax=Vararia minispora EC-137 TaxID=1314806 RepID=A0ACB8QWE6_9AGAM|nr:hypothetical protein K488DRAFT_82809 [Vararia minispora EC-137]
MPSKRDTSSLETDQDLAPTPRPRRDIRKPRRYRTPTPDTFPDPDPDPDPDVDVVGSLSDAGSEPVPDPEPAPTTKKATRRAVVISDEEEEDDAPPPPPPKRKARRRDNNSEDDDFGAPRSDDEPDPPAKKRKLPAVPKRGGSSGKDREAPAFRDERTRGTSDGTPMDLESPAPPSPAVSKPPQPPPQQQKLKLPKIKKIAGGPSSAGATPQRPPLVRSKPTEKEKEKEKERERGEDDGLAALIKKPRRETGQKSEVDLMDKNTYLSLFKPVGGAAPRSGVDAKSQEEKRRAIERMREEDIARRAAQSANTFDLRAQYDKISSFAERLHNRRSPAVYPNILAASLRHERDRRKRREQGGPA